MGLCSFSAQSQEKKKTIKNTTTTYSPPHSRTYASLGTGKRRNDLRLIEQQHSYLLQWGLFVITTSYHKRPRGREEAHNEGQPPPPPD